MSEVDKYIANLYESTEGGLLRIVDFNQRREIIVTMPARRMANTVNLSIRIIKTGERKQSFKFDSLESALSAGLLFLSSGFRVKEQALIEVQKCLENKQYSQAQAILEEYLGVSK